MAFATHPLTPARFEDFADVVNPNRRATHCWCLSHRLQAKDIGDDREATMRAVVKKSPPGVVTYSDGTPVGWCSIAPRSRVPRLQTTKLLTTDDEHAWTVICLVVRSGHRKQGVTTAMLDGALGYAKGRGAKAVEAYPADPPGRLDLTMAFVGTRHMFEKVGFEVVATTEATASGLPRLRMRKEL